METIQECYMLFWTNPENSTSQNSDCTATYFSPHEPYKGDEQDMLDIAEEVRVDS